MLNEQKQMRKHKRQSLLRLNHRTLDPKGAETEIEKKMEMKFVAQILIALLIFTHETKGNSLKEKIQEILDDKVSESIVKCSKIDKF